MDLVSTPDALGCTECGDEVAGTGYLPATATGEGYEPHPDHALCDDCGFNEIGMMGCAPELDEVMDSGPEDVLLYIEINSSGVNVISTKR